MDDVLVLEALEVRYRSGFSVGPVSARLGPGVYHMKGGNGSGKSTLLRAMCAEIEPYQGRCLVCGVDTWRVPAGRRDVSYVSASPELPTFLKVDECWSFFAAMRGRPDWEGGPWREALGIDGSLPLAHASSGQRRRAELLAAIAGEPAVLLLDEVFTHLDAEAVEVLAGWIEGWREERVVWLTSHSELPVVPDAVWEMRAGEALELLG